jgi:hypothetical protein
MKRRDLHPDERKLLDEARRTLGDGMAGHAYYDERGVLQPIGEADVAVICMNAGVVQEAVDAARAAADIYASNPKVRLLLAINGVGEDPREIDEIPASRASLQALYANLPREVFRRFEKDHQALMLVACGRGARVGNALITDEPVEDPAHG